jgi:ABC-type Fe3+/spermidine/putrescine transport system ATPase subunit
MRPERVVLSPSASLNEAHKKEWNCCRGTVTNLSFLGNILRQTVLIEPSITIVVDTQNSSQAFAVEQGDLVTVSWRVDDSVLLRVNE